MPHYLCKKCHHEFDSCDSAKKCDWCKSKDLKVLESTTSFEKFTKHLFKQK